MGRAPSNLPNRRSQPGSVRSSQHLSDADNMLYRVIKSKQDMGMWKDAMRWETKLQDSVIEKSLKVLQQRNLIKIVVNVQSKGKKHYMAVEFEPAKEVSGGTWYSEGNLDVDFIDVLKRLCMKMIENLKIATIEGISDSIRRTGSFKVECSTQQIAEIVQALVLDNEVEELRSTGTGDFSFVPLGKTCYRRMNRASSKTVGALASIPCGVCPHINECTPDGVINPISCVYYKKWLDF